MTVTKSVKDHGTQRDKASKRLLFHFSISSKMNSSDRFPNTKYMSNLCSAGRKIKGSWSIGNLGRLGHPGRVLQRVQISQRVAGGT